MARRKTIKASPTPEKKPSLLVPRVEVEKKLQERIKIGKELQTSQVSSLEDISELKDKQKKWNAYNVEFLSRCFDVLSVSEKHARVSSWGALVMNPSPQQKLKSFIEGIGGQITSLESILELLELIPESVSTTTETPTNAFQNTGKNDSVFIVHGHDETVKTKVARFVEKLGLKAIILHEQPNKGQTIIEKFEANAAEVGFAIVLLTPDDIAASKDTPEDTCLRARQNVILELGYFCAALGRDKVCVLYKEDVEIPSDYIGVVYTQLDNSDGWHLKLAKEMKEASLNVDLNDIL